MPAVDLGHDRIVDFSVSHSRSTWARCWRRSLSGVLPSPFLPRSPPAWTAARQFDEALAQRQMDQASKLAREQLSTAQAAASAAKWAAGAAVLAALGAIGQVIVAIAK